MHSVACRDHFIEDSFEGMAEKLGLKIMLILKPDTVPTIFPQPFHTSQVAKSPQITQDKNKPASLLSQCQYSV